MVFRILHWTSRIALGALFIYSGYVKIASYPQFAADLTRYQLFPDMLILPLSKYFPWAEIILGLGMVAGWKLRYFAMATAVLLSMFTIILTITYLRGIEANCGCFGSGDPISPLTIARDALILVPAVFLAFRSQP